MTLASLPGFSLGLITCPAQSFVGACAGGCGGWPVTQPFARAIGVTQLPTTVASVA